jgi:hypothetical protein
LRLAIEQAAPKAPDTATEGEGIALPEPALTRATVAARNGQGFADHTARPDRRATDL